MFKLAMFIRFDGATVNPFKCSYIRSYLSDGVVVITKALIDLIGGTKPLNEMCSTCVRSMVIITNEKIEIDPNTSYSVKIVQNMKSAIRYLSEHHQDQAWWIVGDNESCNKFIRQGIVMQVHLTKCYDYMGSADWDYINSNTIDQPTIFDKRLVENNNFDLISNVRCLSAVAKSIRHYVRQNREELNLLTAMQNIINTGFRRPNRTGINTRSLFGQQLEYRMIERVDDDGISSFRLPLLTTKRMFTRGVFSELKWFLRGGTNSKELEQDGVNIWKGNTTREYLDSINLTEYNEGETGPIYGFQWKHWNAKYEQGKHDYTNEGIDQVENVIQSLQDDPYGRRHIISGWNVEQISQMCLPPCHVLYQFMVHYENGQKYLSLMMTQRSCDVFLGLPFNICSLGMFLMMMAHRVNMKPYKIIHSIADFHLYENHIESAKEQIQRDPCCFPYIRINCDPKLKLEDYEFKDIVIEDYNHHNAIKADMAV